MKHDHFLDAGSFDLSCAPLEFGDVRVANRAIYGSTAACHNQTRPRSNPHLNSITSSARVSTADGMVRPSAFVDRSLGRLAHTWLLLPIQQRRNRFLAPA
jgi:hypothetical protein